MTNIAVLSRKGSHLQYVIAEHMQKIIGSYPDLLTIEFSLSEKIKTAITLIKKTGPINFVYFLISKFYETKILKDFYNRLEVQTINFRDELNLCQHFQSKKYDLIILGQTTYINSKVLKSGNFRFINVHPAKLPEYRGYAEPAHAILKNDVKNIGATIHLATSKLDSGNVIAFVPVNLSENDSLNLVLTKTRIAGFIHLFELIKEFNVEYLFSNNQNQNPRDLDEVCKILPMAVRFKLDILIFTKRIKSRFEKKHSTFRIE